MKRFIIFIVFFISLSVYAKHVDRDPFVEPKGKTSDSVFLVNKIIILHYINAKTVEKLINNAKTKLLSRKGVVIAENDDNQIWISDMPSRIKRITEFARSVDMPSKQILIQARIVNIDSNYLQALGVQFGKITFPLTKISHLGNLDVKLEALEQQGKANVIASPQLVTKNNLTATIESGEEVPYQERTISGATNIAFKKAVLSLKVTPSVVSKNSIELKLKITQNKPSDRVVWGVPGIDTQELSTNVSVKNGQTIVLGGVYQTIRGEQTIKVPLLGSLPILGHAFRHHQQVRKRRLLLVFITPQVI